MQFSRYLEQKRLLHPVLSVVVHQQKTSCFFKAVDHLVNSLGEGKAVCAAFLDLRKAFDSLDHCLLLKRVRDLGVSSSLLC